MPQRSPSNVLRSPTMPSTPSTVRGVLEACVYASDLLAAERFYTRVIGLELHARVPSRHVFFRCGRSMFLVFNPAATAKGTRIEGRRLSPSGQLRLRHGARGAGHVAFEVREASLSAWRKRLTRHRVPIEAEVDWPGGGRSIYFRDPAGNSVELATRAVWSV